MVAPWFVFVALLLAACGATEPTPLATDATPPQRPKAPDGWVTIGSHTGDAELTVPPDLGRLGPDSPVGVLVQAQVDGQTTPIQVWATGASALPDQPAAGESVRSWLERGSWFPKAGQGGVTAIDDVSERQVLLPAGRALELAATAQPGSSAASRVVAWAIETRAGLAVLQILGEPAVLEARADELRLIPLLVRFGD